MSLPPGVVLYCHCQWEGCEFITNDLEKMRNHVLTHQEEFEDKKGRCAWKGCEHEKYERQNFFKSHVEKEHADMYTVEYFFTGHGSRKGVTPPSTPQKSPTKGKRTGDDDD